MTNTSRNLRAAARVRLSAARQRGFGLVELMVSMLIGLVIIGALVTLFVNTSGGNRELARANSMIENGRFAIKVLEDDLGHAGYWGGYIPMFDDQTASLTVAPTDDPGAIPDPCQDPTTWTSEDRENLIGIRLARHNLRHHQIRVAVLQFPRRAIARSRPCPGGAPCARRPRSS